MKKEKLANLLKKIPFAEKLHDIQFIRYLFVGVSTVGLDVGIYSTLVFLGMPFSIAETIKHPIVLFYNYNSHKYITFQKKEKKGSEIILYLMNAFFLWVLGVSILAFLVEVVGFGEIVSKLFQVIIIAFINYFLLRKLVFRKNSSDIQSTEL